MKEKEPVLFPNEEELNEIEVVNRPRKKRFIVRIGDKIHLILIKDIVYFISREKTTYLINNEGRAYIVDMSLENLEHTLDKLQFFRINRACIVNLDYIRMATRHFSGRLRLTIDTTNPEDDFFVSRIRTGDFVKWINQ